MVKSWDCYADTEVEFRINVSLFKSTTVFSFQNCVSLKSEV